MYVNKPAALLKLVWGRRHMLWQNQSVLHVCNGQALTEPADTFSVLIFGYIVEGSYCTL